MTTATTTQTNRTKETAGAESELRAAATAAGAHDEGACGPDGRECVGYLSQIANGGRPWTPKMREKVCGGAGRGPRAGNRLPPGRRRDRREQLHQGSAHAPWA